MPTTTTTTEIRFFLSTYPEGTEVEILSGLVDDGVCLCGFPNGEETYVAAWRLTDPPPRARNAGDDARLADLFARAPGGQR